MTDYSYVAMAEGAPPMFCGSLVCCLGGCQREPKCRVPEARALDIPVPPLPCDVEPLR